MSHDSLFWNRPSTALRGVTEKIAIEVEVFQCETEAVRINIFGVDVGNNYSKNSYLFSGRAADAENFIVNEMVGFDYDEASYFVAAIHSFVDLDASHRTDGFPSFGDLKTAIRQR